MSRQLLLGLILQTVGWCAVTNKGGTNVGAWSLKQFSSLITFGDSYTDENRLNYFIQNGGVAPPTGTFLPEQFNTPSGGRTWPRYVVQYTYSEANGECLPGLTLYNYAVSGAVCSNKLTPRVFPAINAYYPSVIDYEIPAFIADKAAVRNGTGEAYFAAGLEPDNAVYTMWIGTNDVGVGAFLTNSQTPGKVLTDYTDCVFSAFDSLYSSGGRYFVLFNLAPLHLTPLYANDSQGGVGPVHAWPDKPSNHSAIAEQMLEYVRSLNNVYQYQLPFEVLLSARYPRSNFALFDVYKLLLEIHTNPESYLNGTAPANVTGFEHHCSFDGTTCYDTFNATSPDSFLWHDELHPSEQTDRIIAREFLRVLGGNSGYARYYSS